MESVTAFRASVMWEVTYRFGVVSPEFCRSVEILIYLLTAIGLSAGDSSRVHIYTQTIYRTT